MNQVAKINMFYSTSTSCRSLDKNSLMSIHDDCKTLERKALRNVVSANGRRIASRSEKKVLEHLFIPLSSTLVNST